MIHTAEELYQLLPAIYRIRDEQEQRGALRALVGVLAKEAAIVERDIAQLNDNWFIETCEEWVVPYIGDLLGVRGLHAVSAPTFSLRARVAHTLAYRRRKGTAAMLEQLARDSTGWPAHAVEFFELLHWTQNQNHLRPKNAITPDLRRTAALELLDTPFDTIAHTADVRHIASRRGRHNIPNIGLFLWRLEAYPLNDHAGAINARRTGTAPNFRFTFSPLGFDAPLFNSPVPETDITHLAEEINVPAALRRRPLYDELEAGRLQLANNQTRSTLYFGKSPVCEVFINSETKPVNPEEILICDLSDWRTPAPAKTYRRADNTTVTMLIRAAVDPKLGRIRFPKAEHVTAARVNYSYGFSGDLGGGPYKRSASLAKLRTLDGRDALVDRITWQVGVSQTRAPIPNTIFSKLSDAIDAWNAQPPGTLGSIAVLDSRTYLDNLVAHQIKIPEASQLLIFAADLPHGRPLSTAVAAEQRPHLRRRVSVWGTAPVTSDVPGELILHGLLFEKEIDVAPGNLGRLCLHHSTIAPQTGRLVVHPTNVDLLVRLERSICGPIHLPNSVKRLEIEQSIVDGGMAAAVQASEARADVEGCTFFGQVLIRQLEASNSIFVEKVKAKLRQAGCVRFCFLAGGSETPRRYRCQPDLALQGVADIAAQDAIRSRIKPAFTSHEYGQPGYAQLRLTVPEEIRAGADDGAEMGAFQFLQQPQREANLESSLEEYLRFGLEAGIFFVT
ncbi:MAG TPA: hypothetical protein VGW57_13695 [Chthoniobacterales bacterium]|nr:hypothetical protein [Chthoniobacterales bacterium]